MQEHPASAASHLATVTYGYLTWWERGAGQGQRLLMGIITTSRCIEALGRGGAKLTWLGQIYEQRMTLCWLRAGEASDWSLPLRAEVQKQNLISSR